MTPAPVLVIGSGLAGAVCARALARLGQRVLLARNERQSLPAVAEICGPAARRLLEGTFERPLQEEHHAPLRHFQSAWGSGRLETRTFAFWHASDALVVDRRALEAWLLEGCAVDGITRLHRCDITNAARTDAGWQVEAQVGGKRRALQASFIVEATGRAARLANAGRTARLMTDSLVCTWFEVPDTRGGESTAVVESCPEGWWYTACRPNGSRVIALFTDADLIGSRGTRLNRMRLALARSEHIAPLAGPLVTDTCIHACDARTSIRHALPHDRRLVIGDAAWALDPLSGAGIQRAAVGGLAAAAAIADAQAHQTLEPLRQHALGQVQSFAAALETQRRYYEMETRWQNAPFWQRRLRTDAPHQARLTRTRTRFYEPPPLRRSRADNSSRCSDLQGSLFGVRSEFEGF